MIDRITDFQRPKPPFGFCAMSDGTAYANHDTDYAFLNERQPGAHICPAGTNLHHRVRSDDDDSGPRREPGRGLLLHPTRASCSPGATTARIGTAQCTTAGCPRTASTSRSRSPVEPGTPSQYASPLYRVNTRTGYAAPPRRWHGRRDVRGTRGGPGGEGLTGPVPRTNESVRIDLHAVAVLVAAATAAPAQTASVFDIPHTRLPQAEPYAYDLPRGDPELVAIVDGEYQAFLRDSEAYLRCLDAGRDCAFQRTNEVLAR